MFDIKKQLAWSKLRVGAVIAIAVMLLLLTVFFAGSIEEIFSPKVEIKAQIKDVKGLRKGAPVWVSGIEIGFVKGMSLHSEYGALVTMSINKNSLHFIRKDSTANVMTLGLLGDKYIELSGGAIDAGQIRAGDMIKGRAQMEVKDLIDASSESVRRVSEFINKLGNIVEKIERSEGTAAKLLTDPSLYNNLKQTMTTFSALLKDFQESEGSLKMLMKDPSLYNKMLTASSSVEEFARKMNEGSGTLKKLADDPALYDNLNRASQKLTSILTEIDSGKGAAGALVRDKELATELKDTVTGLKETIEELKELTRDIKSNPKKYFKFSLF